MSEGNNLWTEENDLMKKMKAIASDFWGESAEEPEESPKKAHEEPAKAASPGIDGIWKASDETIDWTEALAHENPTDGLTSPIVWRFYHERAERVLQGDLEAYTEVLIKSNPLGELTAYADRIQMKAVSASRLECSFQCRTDLMEQDPKKYLSAMGVRAARDLLACLPADEVAVTATDGEKTLMEAVYPRRALLHRNFSFTDPVALTEECGGRFYTE